MHTYKAFEPRAWLVEAMVGKRKRGAHKVAGTVDIASSGSLAVVHHDTRDDLKGAGAFAVESMMITPGRRVDPQ